ncbi:putative GNAT domain, acyl-CoA N-acyltransferase, glucosamine 6-phosphate N-acetyltransferase [Septoria linicola]|nr:putative GNAT domain, acyl-CoA N-acyltransferase, glucosamine 6-phosphate N-acetyltransferase [Septoria linicola]
MSEFVDLVKPLGERLKHYDPTKSPTDQPDNDAVHAADPARAVPQGFIDAMIVREEVYVKEQNIPLEHELDEDDPRSFHWIAYASVPARAVVGNDGAERTGSGSTKIPIGTIRLVPPPHAPHPVGDGHDFPQGNGASHEPNEPYIKIGRLAVIPDFRKTGISKLLIETVLAYAKAHPYEVGPLLDPASMEALKKGLGVSWKGLVLLHAQTGVQKVWKRYGFETDQSMGHWDEEGIDHVAMWRRVSVDQGRRTSKIWLHTNNPVSP